MDFEKKILELDVSLFDKIPSQTLGEDQHSLLAIQNAIRRRKDKYAYLEIGSGLGGTIQTHLLDPKCERIYSIDPRPSQQPDERLPGLVVTYENNSTARMLELLANIDQNGIKKIKCFEFEASQIDKEQIELRPDIIFIDGEHTRR